MNGGWHIEVPHSLARTFISLSPLTQVQNPLRKIRSLKSLVSSALTFFFHFWASDKITGSNSYGDHLSTDDKKNDLLAPHFLFQNPFALPFCLYAHFDRQR